MDELERFSSLAPRLVRRVEPVEKPGHDRDRDARLDPLSHPRGAANELRERLARDVLHHHEELAVARHDVERRDDVRVVDSGGEARFVHEHGDEFGILRELRVQALDRDGAAEAGLTEEAPEMDGRHPSRRDLVVQGIAPDDPGATLCTELHAPIVAAPPGAVDVGNRRQRHD